MEKDYQAWHQIKTKVNNKPPMQRFHEREIWWCNVGSNVGFEEDGKNKLFERPVLIIRKFNKELFMGIPLTTKLKADNPYYFPVKIGGVDGSIILSQLRVFSSRRLLRKVERLSSSHFEKLKHNLIEVLLKKSIPVDKSAGSPVPSGNLYLNSSKQSDKKQAELANIKPKSQKE